MAEFGAGGGGGTPSGQGLNPQPLIWWKLAVGVGIYVVSELFDSTAGEKKGSKMTAENALEKATGKNPVSKAVIEILFGGQQLGAGEEKILDTINQERAAQEAAAKKASEDSRPRAGVQMLPLWDADP